MLHLWERQRKWREHCEGGFPGLVGYMDGVGELPAEEPPAAELFDSGGWVATQGRDFWTDELFYWYGDEGLEEWEDR